jgi:hypothetical protein
MRNIVQDVVWVRTIKKNFPGKSSGDLPQALEKFGKSSIRPIQSSLPITTLPSCPGRKCFR